MNILLRVVRDICTNKNDKDFCHSKTLGTLACVWMIAVGSVEVYKGNRFDPISWGTAIGSLILSAAGGAKIKETTEPQ